jgi:hypothetical protein
VEREIMTSTISAPTISRRIAPATVLTSAVNPRGVVGCFLEVMHGLVREVQAELRDAEP